MAIPKKLMNFCYGMGAAVVIIGALFKITHIELGPLNGNNMLTVGLLVEALIFAISAFEPVDEDVDWSRVYPELKGGEPRRMQIGGVVQTSSVSGTSPISVQGSSSVASTKATPASAYQTGATFAGNVSTSGEERGMLSEKLDKILKDAKIDGE